jgi:signal transduction histidine kinase
VLRASLLDITEQRAAEAQLSEVLRGTVALQEADRQRIARELHDSLGQYLAALNMKLEMFGRTVGDSAGLTSGVDELKGLTGLVGEEVSRLAWELRPIVLDDIGLEPAIRRLADQWAERVGLQIDLHLALKRRRLPPQVETTLYRVLQEGVTNIVKHASASKVGVVVRASPNDVVMMIEDDGKGFDPEALKRGAAPRLGLLGIRERLALIRGSLEIETGSSAGTTLIIRVPLKDSAAGSI